MVLINEFALEKRGKDLKNKCSYVIAPKSKPAERDLGVMADICECQHLGCWSRRITSSSLVGLYSNQRPALATQQVHVRKKKSWLLLPVVFREAPYIILMGI